MSYRFQHNKSFIVTSENYKHVLNQRKTLLSKLTSVLKEHDIKWVLGHGNLIECVRGEPIYHDDDIDIRLDIDDIHKWIQYQNSCVNGIDEKYGLKYDDRYCQIEKQKYNGIQVELIETMPPFRIHADIVFNIVGSDFWLNYLIDYDSIKPVRYLDCDCYIPNDDDTARVLITQYGNNYLIPNIRKKIIYSKT